MSFINELKHRNVFKVIVSYGLVAGLKKAPAGNTAATVPRGTNYIAVILMGVVLVTAVVLQFWGPEMQVQQSTKAAGPLAQASSLHADIAFPEDMSLAFIGAAALGNGRRAFAISPDGAHLVFAGLRDGQYALYLRDLDSHTVRKLGGTWFGNDRILAFTDEGGRMLQFSFGAERLESEMPGRGRAPHVLPDGVHVLWDAGQIVAYDTATRQEKSLAIQGSDPRFVGGFRQPRNAPARAG